MYERKTLTPKHTKRKVKTVKKKYIKLQSSMCVKILSIQKNHLTRKMVITRKSRDHYEELNSEGYGLSTWLNENQTQRNIYEKVN